MRRLFAILALIITISWPIPALAADFKVNLNVVRQDDGTTSTEFWFNDKVVWRLMVLADGAKPVSAGGASSTTFVTPDIINGLFLLKVQ